MTKEILVTILQRDIAELAQLTEGFGELQTIPAALLTLAKSKTNQIAHALQELDSALPQTSAAVIPQATMAEVISVPIAKIPATETIKEEAVPQKAITITPIQEELPSEKEMDIVEETTKVEEPVTHTAPNVVAETVEKEEIEEIEEEIEEIEEEDEVEERPVVEVKVTSVAPTTPRIENGFSPKVDDIKKAISIGDRFLFQRELFDGNGELMSKTIQILNSLHTFAEAEQYLAKKFMWDTENDSVKHFMEIISRKF